MTITDTLEIEEQLDNLEEYSSTGTTLISVYIPADTSIQQMRTRIQNEKSQSQNIKSKQTRSDVLDALNRITKHLQSVPQTPDNGLAIFAGRPRNVDSLVSTIIEPPAPITTSIYHCGKSFQTDPLWKQIQASDEFYGVILIDINNALIGSISGSSVTVHQTFQSLVPGKQSKGGQSQQRFARLRLEALHEFYKKTASAATELLPTDPAELDGILIGGPQHTRSDFIDEEYLHYTQQDAILYQGSVSSISQSGVYEVLENAQQAIKDSKIATENTKIERFMKNLTDNTAVYGLEQVKTAMEYGAIDELLLAKETQKQMESNELKTLTETITEYNGTITTLDCNSEKGHQFETVFTGIGAMLRFPIN
jgi:peptide chain release factor subunit 1